MQTYTGKMVDPLDLKHEQIDIVDIAHHLSLICRWGGATRWHYSVAQHSWLLVEWWLNKFDYPKPDDMVTAQQMLLHDAAEAYLGDMVSPLKTKLPEYQAAEWRAQQVIFERFGVPWPMRGAVQMADAQIRVNEAKALLLDPGSILAGLLASNNMHGLSELEIKPLPPREAEEAFLAWHRTLWS